MEQSSDLLPESSHRYGFFFGSFDPVQEAHVGIIARALEQHHFERIYISVATDKNPRKKYFYDGEQRVRLLESALLPYRNAVEIDRSQVDGLSDHPLASLDRLCQRLPPGAGLTVIVGQDVFETFSTIYDQWQVKPDRYLQELDWLVVARGDSQKLIMPAQILGVDELPLGERLHTAHGSSVHFCNFQLPDCSSSRVKEFLLHTEEVPGCFMCVRQFYREVVETPSFYVMHNEFPLMEGHLLIVSKEHKGSTGCLSDSALRELHAVKYRVGQVLRELYGSAAFYENGRRTCCIARNEDRHITNHFHLNALPFAGDISPQLRATQEMEACTQSIHSLRGFRGVYYYFERDDGRGFFYDLTHKPPEHNTLRRLIADQLGHPEVAGWNKSTPLFSQSARGSEVLTLLRKALDTACRQADS